HIFSKSARAINVGRGVRSDGTNAMSSLTLPSSRNPPSRSVTIPGNGMSTSHSQVVSRDRALRPGSFAQRGISGMPIVPAPKRCRPEPVQTQQHEQCAEAGVEGLACFAGHLEPSARGLTFNLLVSPTRLCPSTARLPPIENGG